VAAVPKKFPDNPPHPERNCWGCDRFCPSTSMICGNGSERTQHPVELFGEGWAQEGLDPFAGRPDHDAMARSDAPRPPVLS
jgi:hypothetical protein